MLIQLHRQNDFHPYEMLGMVAQKDIDNSEQLQEWVDEVKKEHVLPKHQMWAIVSEESSYFEMAVSNT